MPTPRLHGYDFSYHGLLGIWESFPPIDGNSQSHRPIPPDETPLAIQRSLLLDLPVADARHKRAGSNGSRGHSARREQSPADDLHGNWSAALATLASRRSIDRWSWKSPVPTSKLVARQVALQICGWSLREEEIGASIKRLVFLSYFLEVHLSTYMHRWEKDGKLSKAACWLVFIGQYGKAADLLMRSDGKVSIFAIYGTC